MANPNNSSTSHIFILGPHKSGTTLLKNLFDSHPQLAVIPMETHFMKNMGYFTMNEYYRNPPQAVTTSDMIASFTKNTYLYKQARSKLSDSKPETFDFGLFDELIKTVEFAKNKLEANNIYFHSILRSSGIPEDEFTTKIIVEKSVSNVEFALEIKKLYPEAKFIHLVRNPYSNLVSLRKYNTSVAGAPLLNRLVNLLYNSYYFLYKNQDLVQNDYLIIKYEDLIENTEKVMKKICSFSNIEFNPELIKPTVQGVPWQGNSTSNLKFSGVNQLNLNRWEKDIAPIEIFIVNKLFKFILEDYQYNKIPYQGGYFRKIKGENITRYIWNRFIKYMYRYY